MDSYESGRLIYLILLGIAVGGYFLVHNRDRVGQMMQQAAIWGLIFLGVIAGVGLWGDIRDDVAPLQSYVAGEGRIEVPRSQDGHYYLVLELNGARTRFVVDTGATDIVLTRADAERAGFDTDALAYLGRAQTANGTVQTARVMLDEVTLGDITDRRVNARVNNGEMHESLLGMAYLSRFDTLQISNNRLVLER